MKKRVGVLRGGKGEHYEKSLQNGRDLILHIHENLSEKWKIVDILIDNKNIWHADGLPIIPADLIQKVDVVWNTTHPIFSQILNNLSIPYFGNSSFPYLLSNDREILEKHFKKFNIQMPRHLVLPAYQKDFDGPRERYSIKKAKEIHEKFSPPWIIKSFTPDSNIAIHLAKTFPELVNAIEDEVSHNKSILVEEFIIGKDTEVHSLSGFREQEIYNFPFGDFPEDEKEKINSISKEIFKQLGISHYLKSNFKLSSKGKIYFTGIDTFPSLEKGSGLSLVAETVGAKTYNIIEHILEKALNGA